MQSECIDFDTVVSYVAGDLPNNERDRLAEHISKCDNCMENIASAIKIMEDNYLDAWEPMPEKDARIVVEKVDRNLLRLSPEPSSLREKAVKKRFLKWVSGLTPDFSLQYGFARAPSLNGAAVTDHIRTEKMFDDLHADVFMEKEMDKFCIQIKVYKDNKRVKNVRFTLTRRGAGSVSRLSSDGYQLFEGLLFGSYELALAQNLLEKGNYFFEINEEGINEQ